MIKPKTCLLHCSAGYMQCETCSKCPEGVSSYSGKPNTPDGYGWEWCEEWLKANRRQIARKENDV